MNRTIRALIAVLLIGVILFCAIAITQNVGRSWRWDITEKKLYTLSDGTKAILGKLNQPLTLKLYYAKTASLKGPDQIRFFNNYYQFVKALLEEYQSQSGGNVALQVIDPRPYSDEENEAMRYGLKRFPISEEENFFFGLILQTEFGVTKTIPFFDPNRQNFVEYDISYLIDTAITRQKKRIGILSSLPVMGEDVSGYMAQMMRMQGQQPQPSWNIVQQLEQQYEVKKIETDTQEIKTDEVDLLMVIHPKNLEEKTLFAIDQYVLHGGRTIVFVDPHSIVDNAQNSRQQMMYGGAQSSHSDLNKLLKTWGLEMPENTFAGDRSLALMAQPTPDQRPQKIIGFMDLTDDCFSKEVALTADLGKVRLLFPGVLKPLAAEGAEKTAITITPLLSTTNRGNAWSPESPFELMMMNPGTLWSRFKDGTQPVHMAYRLTGKFKSAFPGGIDVEEKSDADKKKSADTPDAGKEKDKEQETKPKHIDGLAEAKSDCAVVVFADVDFITDMVAYQKTIFGSAPVGDNAAMVFNAIDDLSGSSDLISIRSRGSFTRPFTVVDRIEAEAEKDTSAKIEAINKDIEDFQKELNDIVENTKGDTVVLGAEFLQKKKDLEQKIREKQTELRRVQMAKLQGIDALGQKLENLNTLAVPLFILVVAVILGIRRSARKRHYISHTSDS